VGQQFADAGFCQVQQLVHLRAREGFAFGGSLHLDDAPPPVITTFMSVSQWASSA
jgi:hypothetical protein